MEVERRRALDKDLPEVRIRGPPAPRATTSWLIPPLPLKKHTVPVIRSSLGSLAIIEGPSAHQNQSPTPPPKKRAVAGSIFLGNMGQP